MKRVLLIMLALMLTLQSALAQFVFGNAPKLLVGLTNTAVVVKAAAGALVTLSCWNPTGAVAYVQVYDSAGTVMVGTTVPKLSFAFAQTASANYSIGVALLTGIQVAATTTANGGSAPASPLNCNATFQ